jgi:hypothetical protein
MLSQCGSNSLPGVLLDGLVVLLSIRADGLMRPANRKTNPVSVSRRQRYLIYLVMHLQLRQCVYLIDKSG